MPSVTLTTVPMFRASAADWNFSMRALMRSLISDALMDISILLASAAAAAAVLWLASQFGSQALQAALEGPIDHQIARMNDRAPEERGVHAVAHVHAALESRVERSGKLVGLRRVELHGRDHLDVHGVLDFRTHHFVVRENLGQQQQPV